MGVDPTQLTDLAQQCSDQADALQQAMKDANYTGPNIDSMTKTVAALHTQVIKLNTAVVGAALAASDDAGNQLKAAIAKAAQVTKTIADIKKGLQIGADLISLAGAALGGNPTAVIGAAVKLIGDATAPASPPPPTSSGTSP